MEVLFSEPNPTKDTCIFSCWNNDCWHREDKAVQKRLSLIKAMKIHVLIVVNEIFNIFVFVTVNERH